MSTRSLIAMQIDNDKFKRIYCHFDGYLTYNGAMLLDYYNTPEKVKELIELGDISCLAKNINPDPSKKHGFNYSDRQEDVVVAYGRERGEKDREAKECTLAELDNNNSWANYIYIFTNENKWKYFTPGHPDELLDVESELNSIYREKELSRPKGYYGYLDDEVVDELKNLSLLENNENEMEVQ